jgi:hypothetical protein
MTTVCIFTFRHKLMIAASGGNWSLTGLKELRGCYTIGGGNTTPQTATS